MPRINVLEYLDEIAARLPDKPAFCDGGLRLSFGEADRRSRAVGSALAARGFYGEPVVVFMEKGPAAVSAFFGALRAGCFYVPLDEEMPRHRIELIFGLLRPRAVIYDQSARAALEGLDFHGAALAYDELVLSGIDEPALRNIRARAIDTDPIYVVFTSGSTGKPKGVAACHRSVIDYVENLAAVLRVDENTVFGNQAPLYVDACLKELYPTLMFGATTWFVPKQYFSFPLKLVEFLNEKRVNTVCWVASAFTMVAALRILDEVRPEHLRTAAFGSEVFPVKQLNAWLKACPGARFLNLYGPTEATGMSCYYELPAGAEYAQGDRIPIGGPFRNTDVFLLDEQNQRIEASGAPGEICIRGTCLTLGYYADPARTAQSFTQNPLHGRYDEKIYRTGDLAQYNEKGELLFLSRKDYQIKRAGYRIELGEIESAAHSVEGVHAACCLFDDAKKKIVLCYAGVISRAQVSEALKAKLPQYMMPNAAHRLDALPMTPNGKIDRNGLKEAYL
ncbi:MAG: amino acid adenylation domain-containing protein [Oscillospiraceae bacterium]|jgi:amino acid adenylation domain-containing protein|nr:amino acid adenylation domain-containing protein [Oscillospiraceae bacterium]